uniref:Uncharacterized protein n=1 Tax=Meloidogyne javanica TaxID=6303 RepID=A0A915M0W2_MELJA
MSGLKERPVYKEIRRFRSRQAFLYWWKDNEDVGWRINSRNPSREGTVEYWKCAFKQDKVFACLASLRIVFGRHDRFVTVARNIMRPHCHTQIRGLKGEDEERIFQEVAAFPMQTAEIIRFPSQPAGTEGLPENPTADSALPTAIEIGMDGPSTSATNQPQTGMLLGASVAGPSGVS